MDFLLSYIMYHSRYSSLQKGDFVDNFGSQALDYNWMGPDWKGQFLFNTSNHVDMTDVSNVNEETPMIPKEEEYYRKIIELAQDENIPIVVIVAPYALEELPTLPDVILKNSEVRSQRSDSILKEDGWLVIEHGKDTDSIMILIFTISLI